MDIIAAIAEELQIKKGQAEAAVKLIDEGNTIPFIARYRKEATGSLNDEVLRNLFDRLTYLRNLEDKKQTVLASIEEQGKLTDELKKAILEAQTQVAVDDLYRPYRPKRRTRATIAKEKGLEPLAQTILAQESSVDIMAEAAKYVDAEKDVADEAAALAGAKDIIAENVSDNAGYRTKIRELTMQKGRLISTAKDPEAESVYEMYYEFDEALSKVAGHRTLAINRGEKEKILTVKIEAPTEDIIKYLKKQVITNDGAPTAAVLTEVVEDAYDRLIAPAIEREIRNNLTEEAEDGAHKGIRKELGAASHAASNCRTGCAWMGSGIPYRLQDFCRRPYRKGARYHSNLPDSTTEQGRGGKGRNQKAHRQASCHSYLTRKRNSIA